MAEVKRVVNAQTGTVMWTEFWDRLSAEWKEEAEKALVKKAVK